jgi:hypothetical protein
MMPLNSCSLPENSTTDTADCPPALAEVVCAGLRSEKIVTFGRDRIGDNVIPSK